MNVYEIVTNRVLASLEKGIIPWQKPWKAEPGSVFPKNFYTGNLYRGINILLLWPGEFAVNSWISYRQALKMGGNVRKGEKGTPIVFCKPIEREQSEAEETGREHYYIRYSTVFNIEQCEGLPVPEPAAPRPPVEPITRCEQLVEDWKSRPGLNLDNPLESRAYYRPLTDVVHMPMRDRFVNAEHYYVTLFHELTHSTGHSSRLNREFGPRFGDDLYSREELIAEMGAAFLSAHAEIDNTKTDRNTMAYIQHWMQQLKGDARLVVQAASQAQRAVDMIVGTSAVAEENIAKMEVDLL